MTTAVERRRKGGVTADRGGTVAAMRSLWPFMWPADRPDLKQRVAFALAALVVAKVATVLVPFAYKWATDALVPAGTTSTDTLLVAAVATPIFLVVAYGVGRVMSTGFTQLRDALFAKVGQHAVRRLAFRTFVHLHDLSLRFHLERRTGGLSRVISRGTNGIESMVRHTLLNMVPTALEFAFAAAIIGYHFGLSYLLVVVATVVVYVAFTVVASNRRIAIRRAMNDSDTDANSKAVDSLLNYETVKYFGNEGLESRRFDVAMERYQDAATKTWTSLAWLNLGQTVIFTIGMTIAMVMSASEVVRGTLTIGDFVLINALLIQLAIPLNFIGTLYREIKQGLADIETMFTLLDEPAEIVDRPGAPALEVREGAVRFDDVRFGYDPARPILKGVTFDIPAGHSVAIVGPSGAGKSTISRLLFRFYDIGAGSITIDGQDLREVSQTSLRAAIGMVPQDTVLFNDTIAYNIRYGRPDATEEEVRQAAELAQIADFIQSLPKGYDTEVGERGLKLSGGEKQRVAIARTILKGPPILVLDEATSALDSHTEREIQGALDRVSTGRTTLIIAHRLSTVVHVDQILVLKDGVIVERGRHAELMAERGLYASMWSRQQEAEEAAERLRRVQEQDPGFLAPMGTPDAVTAAE
ncbi:MAG: ABC transporter ATP-binding protein/permease [Bauldia sp.]|nr:ABC transporter ATP-binding protein/permease [Bauldia sp.]